MNMNNKLHDQRGNCRHDIKIGVNPAVNIYPIVGVNPTDNRNPDRGQVSRILQNQNPIQSKTHELIITAMEVRIEKKALIEEFVEDLDELLETEHIYDILLHKKRKWQERLEG
jgi:hypothetical protein